MPHGLGWLSLLSYCSVPNECVAHELAKQAFMCRCAAPPLCDVVRTRLRPIGCPLGQHPGMEVPFFPYMAHAELLVANSRTSRMMPILVVLDQAGSVALVKLLSTQETKQATRATAFRRYSLTQARSLAWSNHDRLPCQETR